MALNKSNTTTKHFNYYLCLLLKLNKAAFYVSFSILPTKNIFFFLTTVLQVVIRYTFFNCSLIFCLFYQHLLVNICLINRPSPIFFFENKFTFVTTAYAIHQQLIEFQCFIDIKVQNQYQEKFL